MGFGAWVKSLFSKFMAAFNTFIKEAFDNEMKILIGQFSEFAIVVVGKLATTDLTSESKRAEAFKEIKEEAIKRGKTLSDSLINVLIELAVSHLKTNTPENK